MDLLRVSRKLNSLGIKSDAPAALDQKLSSVPVWLGFQWHMWNGGQVWTTCPVFTTSEDLLSFGGRHKGWMGCEVRLRLKDWDLEPWETAYSKWRACRVENAPMPHIIHLIVPAENEEALFSGEWDGEWDNDAPRDLWERQWANRAFGEWKDRVVRRAHQTPGT